MREIKFREWDGKRWNYWGYNVLYDGVFKGPQNPTFPSQQYTGLKDKNGVKIFEGDIVKRDNRVYEVMHDVDSGSIRLGEPKKGGPRLTSFQASRFEIIGNIYEGEYVDIN